jgi:hypothetical protein
MRENMDIGVRRGRLILIFAMIAATGCAAFRNPMLDVPISADGITRSPPFELYSDTTYQIFIGLDPMPVDQATCAATYAAQRVAQPPSPCHEIRPAFGEIHWVVTQHGQFIAQGSLPGEPADILRDQGNSWAKSKVTKWGSYSGWFSHAGKDYVIEVSLKSASVNLQPFHPRVAIVEPL